MSTIPGYLTLAEAAKEIGVSHAQCSRYAAGAKPLLPYVKVGNQKLIPTSAVETFTRPPIGNPNFRRKARGKRAS